MKMKNVLIYFLSSKQEVSHYKLKVVFLYPQSLLFPSTHKNYYPFAGSLLDNSKQIRKSALKGCEKISADNSSLSDP